MKKKTIVNIFMFIYSMYLIGTGIYTGYQLRKNIETKEES